MSNVRDIIPRREAEEALRAARDQLQAILAGIPDGILVQDGDGQLLYANESAARLIGLPSVDALLNPA